MPPKPKNKHAGSKYKFIPYEKGLTERLKNRAYRARYMDTCVNSYLLLPSKVNREAFDLAVLDCAKAIRRGKKK